MVGNLVYKLPYIGLMILEDFIFFSIREFWWIIIIIISCNVGRKSRPILLYIFSSIVSYIWAGILYWIDLDRRPLIGSDCDFDQSEEYNLSQTYEEYKIRSAWDVKKAMLPVSNRRSVWSVPEVLLPGNKQCTMSLCRFNAGPPSQTVAQH